MKRFYSSRAEQILSNAMAEMKRRKLARKENVGARDTTEQKLQVSVTTKKRLISDEVWHIFVVLSTWSLIQNKL